VLLSIQAVGALLVGDRRSRRTVTVSNSPNHLLSAFEICAGGGGQALGLQTAGFSHVGLVDSEASACATLRLNRPTWAVVNKDIRQIDGRHYRGIDLLAGGVPCPPFSAAGKQLGSNDDRDLFPEALRLIRETKPSAIMLENVRGFATEKFISYRRDLLAQLELLGYRPDWRVLEAARFGVPQLRPRFFLIALRPKHFARFRWPVGSDVRNTVASAIHDLIGERGWAGVAQWKTRADRIAPTIVGGSHRHGGPDLGPTRARAAWKELGVDGGGIADEPVGVEFPVDGLPRLTLRMVARLQGFPDNWTFVGRKTAAYRQVGNALPPQVATAVGNAIRLALLGEQTSLNVEDYLGLSA
jgi:DNA (cytosine-5)-methyltransferase 1